MKTVAEIAHEIVAREGGFTNDPDDPGGATNHGVTIGTMQRLGLDLTGDGQVSVADVRAVTAAEAERIFIKHYFEAANLATLPEPLQATVFDMYVNAGAGAIRILQRLLAEMGQDIAVDGALGPQTAAAVQAALAAAPEHFVDAYGIARRNFYYALGDGRPQSRKYARRESDGGKGGWIKRAEEFISPRFHLTEAQHRARVAAWG